jgi:hypothetical protein
MRFLLIDEDEFASSVLTLKLKECFQCHVDQVKSIQKGLRHLKTERPYDYIICSSENQGVEVKQFHERHSIKGEFLFYTNSFLQVDSSEFNQAQIVPRLSFENLRTCLETKSKSYWIGI